MIVYIYNINELEYRLQGVLTENERGDSICTRTLLTKNAKLGNDENIRLYARLTVELSLTLAYHNITAYT